MATNSSSEYPSSSYDVTTEEVDRLNADGEVTIRRITQAHPGVGGRMTLQHWDDGELREKIIAVITDKSSAVPGTMVHVTLKRVYADQ